MSLLYPRIRAISSTIVSTRSKHYDKILSSWLIRYVSSGTASSSSSLSTRSSTILRPSQPFNPSINPPSSVYSPPLNLPARSEATSGLSHKYSLAKIYIGFYRQGLRNVIQNWRLSRTIRRRIKAEAKTIRQVLADGGLIDQRRIGPQSKSKQANDAEADSVMQWLGERGPTLDRGEMQLMRRSSRDMRKLPLFLGLFLATFEFFPLVVGAMSGVLRSRLPVPVLLPTQAQELRRDAVQRWNKADQRWRKSGDKDKLFTASADKKLSNKDTELPLEEFDNYVLFMADFHGLHPKWVPRAMVPLFVLAARVNRHVEYLRWDDQLLGRDTVHGLTDEEVTFAAIERGLWDEEVLIVDLRERLQKSVNQSYDLERRLKREVEIDNRRRPLVN